MASVFAIEWCIRALIPQYDPSGHVAFITKQDGLVIAKERGNLRQIKNTGDYNVEIYISDLGLREPKNLKTAKPSDVFVVGDSFSFGWGVKEEDRFSNKLDAFLLKRNVFNISIPADLDGYEKLLNYAKKHGAKIKKLIIGITMENDLRLYNKIPLTKET